MTANVFTPNAPTPEDAAAVLEAALGYRACSVTRFPMGLAHYVYDILTDAGENVVVRLTRRGQAAAFRGAVAWSERLRGIGVPLPRLLYADAAGTANRFPVLIMERLPGSDLGLVYGSLSTDEKRDLATRIVDIQRRVARLPEGSGFGYGADEADRHLLPTWRLVLDQHLERSRSRMRADGLVEPAIVDRVAARLNAFASAFDGVRPVCFLDDTTTKNVLIYQGQLSGIVDVDTVCYGDPLRTVALTRMSLLASRDDTVYTDAWTAALDLSPARLRLLDLYTAMYGVDFLSEIGHVFNRDEPIAGSAEQARHLSTIVDELLGD